MKNFSLFTTFFDEEGNIPTMDNIMLLTIKIINYLFGTKLPISLILSYIKYIIYHPIIPTSTMLLLLLLIFKLF